MTQTLNTENKNYGYCISIVERDDANWVRVQALGEDFIIAPHDLDDGKDNFNYDTVKARLKKLGLDTFNRKQGFIIATLIEEINTKLEESGGDKFAEDWYISSELWKPVGYLHEVGGQSTSADYPGNRTWYFGGTSGCFSYSPRCYSGFRARPVLAYPLGD